MINIFKKFLSIFKRTTTTTDNKQHYAIDIRMDPTSSYSFTLDSNISKKITREYIIDALPEDMQLHIIPKILFYSLLLTASKYMGGVITNSLSSNYKYTLIYTTSLLLIH